MESTTPCLGCSSFEDTKSCNNRLRHTFPGPSNLEILIGSLCLSSPIPTHKHLLEILEAELL